MTEDGWGTPDILARVHGTDGEVTIDGATRRLSGPDPAAASDAVLREIASVSSQLGRSVPFRMDEQGQWWNLVSHPDGSLTQSSSAGPSGPGNRLQAGQQAAGQQPGQQGQSVPRDHAQDSSQDSSQDSAKGAADNRADSSPAGQPPASQPSASQPSAPQSASSPRGRTERGPNAPSYGPASGRRDSPAPASNRRSGSMPGPATQPNESTSWPPRQPSSAQQNQQSQAQQSRPQQAQPQQGGPARQPDPFRSTEPARSSGPTQGWPAARSDDGLGDEPQPRHAVSFLPTEQPMASPPPQVSSSPPQGWFARTFGKKDLGPDPQVLEAQRQEAADAALVSKHWPGPKTIAVVNGKGGSGKTPTTALLAAVFARYGGGGVIAWDNNDTRGTLGWRTASGGHDRTVLDLIPAAEALMDRNAQVGRLAYYVHHQPEDKYDVLRSNPQLLAQDQRLSTEQFHALHDVCNRFYRMILMDSGNDESTYAWLNMIESADQIVVPTSTRPDHAEAGLLLLQALSERSDRCRGLTERAVVVVSQADQDEAAADTIAQGFRQMLPEENVVTIPYDRGIRDSQLRYDRLAPGTRRAFLRAAAAVARQL